MPTRLTPAGPQEFLAFISDMAQVVAEHVQPKPIPPRPLPSAAAVPEMASDSADPFFMDEEKVTWDWPDIGGRAIEDLR